jgi:hypothetical protein
MPHVSRNVLNRIEAGGASDEHSTVWDGKDALFDFNFLALGITATECFDLVHKKELTPRRHHKVHFRRSLDIRTASVLQSGIAKRPKNAANRSHN